jgi:hypothetical protein
VIGTGWTIHALACRKQDGRRHQARNPQTSNSPGSREEWWQWSGTAAPDLLLASPPALYTSTSSHDQDQ